MPRESLGLTLESSLKRVRAAGSPGSSNNTVGSFSPSKQFRDLTTPLHCSEDRVSLSTPSADGGVDSQANASIDILGPLWKSSSSN